MGGSTVHGEWGQDRIGQHNMRSYVLTGCMCTNVCIESQCEVMLN